MRKPDGPASYRDGLTKTIEEADELIKTFNCSPLLIARLEKRRGRREHGTRRPCRHHRRHRRALRKPVAEEAGLRLEDPGREGPQSGRQPRARQPGRRQPVDNAIKYSDGRDKAAGADGAMHGAISISLARVGETIEIAVADQGPGVAPQDRERARQRFVRLEKSRSRPGSGLGLSLVAAVARLHGGSIRLDGQRPRPPGRARVAHARRPSRSRRRNLRLRG